MRTRRLLAWGKECVFGKAEETEWKEGGRKKGGGGWGGAGGRGFDLQE